jgi:murein DD-endopeptidase MepM/ murein hydrolase activator NlpD
MGMIRIASVAAICLLCVLGRVVAGEMQAPRITRADVDWESAAQKLGDIAPLRAVHASAAAGIRGSDIDRLNAAAAERLPDIAKSPVPVLLPFDVESYLRDRAAAHPQAGPEADPSLDPSDKYFAGFGQPALFDPGPAGYDATFRFSVATIPELANIRFGEAADVSISGSLLTYELDPPVSACPGESLPPTRSGADAGSPTRTCARGDAGTSVPALEADFPGIRRIMLENRVRYAFVRFGVPYVVSADCFDASFARYHHIACRDADRVIERFLRNLHIAGGAPQPAAPAAAPPAPERPAEVSPTFTYRAPGRLIPGTGFRRNGGRTDYTVYSNIRFPLAETPAFANTQYYQHRVAGGVAAYPWRDNFCEGRSYAVAQCPAGMGHQGQDIGASNCNRAGVGDDRCGPHHDDVVAVRDGTILRASGQEAVYLVVNTPAEHIRFRYLHMRPKLLDAAGVLSGRRVAAGELLGQIGNFSQHENGTSYHLHFDIQVPTRAGWVFVSPYMTLVAAYERLIGGRGSEIAEDMVASAPIGTSEGASPAPITLAAIRQAILAPNESAAPLIAPAAAPRLRFAGACGWRQRHWRGCGVIPARHAARSTQASHAVRTTQVSHDSFEHGNQHSDQHGEQTGVHNGVRAAVTVRHGSYAARAAVLTHRVYRRHRT